MTCAAILAGGQAQRLGGRDKSQLRLGGRTILERQLEALSTVAPRILLVGYRDDAPVPPGTIRLRDRTDGCGPLGGLETALEAAGDDDVLLLACDMPFLTAALLRHLASEVSDADAVVPRTERGYHPLCAVYTQSCRAAVRRRLGEGQLRMTDLLDELRVRGVDGAELARFGEADLLLANVNTQADLDALESLRSH